MPRSYEKHGLREHTLYETWAGIKKRCYYKKYTRFHDYGGRGIRVCDSWRHSFTNFLSDMGERPFKSATVDRIDNDGDYTPENCKWSTKKEQSNNTRQRRISSRNRSGIPGVNYCNTNKIWLVKYKSIVIFRSVDFFEACCARKSAEERGWG
jgi:hypothetical protein